MYQECVQVNKRAAVAHLLYWSIATAVPQYSSRILLTKEHRVRSVRSPIVILSKDRLSLHQVIARLKVSVETRQFTLKHCEETGAFVSRTGSGRLKVTTPSWTPSSRVGLETEKQFYHRWWENTLFIPYLGNLQIMLNKDHEITVMKVKGRLSRRAVRGAVAATKPLHHRQTRISLSLTCFFPNEWRFRCRVGGAEGCVKRQTGKSPPHRKSVCLELTLKPDLHIYSEAFIIQHLNKPKHTSQPEDQRRAKCADCHRMKKRSQKTLPVKFNINQYKCMIMLHNEQISYLTVQ